MIALTRPHVFLFLIDGLGADFLQLLEPACVMQNEVPTITAPNWVTLLTGLHVKEHLVQHNYFGRNKRFKFNHTTVFDDFDGKSWFISDWRQFSKLVTCPRTTFTYAKEPFHELQQWLRHDSPQLTVINSQLLDTVGHKHGWRSPKAVDVVKQLETQVIKFEAYLRDESGVGPYVVLVTADHGSDGHDDHEDASSESVRRVPLVFITNTLVEKPDLETTVELRGWMRKHLT